MATINYDALYKELSSGVANIAKDSFKDFEAAAKTDGEQALNGLKTALPQWAAEVESGALSKEDLAFLLQEEEALGEMHALKQAGLAEVRIDQFRNSVINMIVGTVTGLIKV